MGGESARARASERERLPEHAVKSREIYKLGVPIVDLQDGVSDHNGSVEIS